MGKVHSRPLYFSQVLVLDAIIDEHHNLIPPLSSKCKATDEDLPPPGQVLDTFINKYHDLVPSLSLKHKALDDGMRPSTKKRVLDILIDQYCNPIPPLPLKCKASDEKLSFPFFSIARIMNPARDQYPLVTMSSDLDETSLQPDPLSAVQTVPMRTRQSASSSSRPDDTPSLSRDFSFSCQCISESNVSPGVSVPGDFSLSSPATSQLLLPLESIMSLAANSHVDIDMVADDNPWVALAQNFGEAGSWATLTQGVAKRNSPQPYNGTAGQLTSKVILKELDYSNRMRQSLYTLRSHFNQTLQQKNGIISEMLAFQSEQKGLVDQLCSDLTAKESIFSQQEERITMGFLERDHIISLQADTMKKLESDLSVLLKKANDQTQAFTSMLAQRDSLIQHQMQSLEQLKQDVLMAQGFNSMAQAELEHLRQDLLLMQSFNSTTQAELSKQVEKMAAKRESELLTLEQSNENFGLVSSNYKKRCCNLPICQRLSANRRRLLSHLSKCQAFPKPYAIIPRPQAQRLDVLPRQDFNTSLACYIHFFRQATTPPRSPGDLNAELIAQQVYSLLAKNPLTPNPLTSSPLSPSPQRRHSKEHVHHLFEEVFQISKDKNFLLVTNPSLEDLKSFAKTGLNGPDPFDLRWDFNHPALLDWNQVVIGMLACKLAGLWEEEQWTMVPKSHAYWVEAITQKFNRIQTVVSKAKLCVLDGHSTETHDQVNDRLVKAKEESLKKARWDARRMVKYKHCLQATQLASQTSEETGMNEDMCAWRFLYGVVRTLGSDGMSSDESGEDDMELIFFTSLMPWQRDMAKELRIIDTSCSPTTKGAKAAKCIKSTNVTLRTPVKGLPMQFYKPVWLAQKQKMASEESFEWLELISHQNVY
ncbi:hypothetical protein JVT61DRAFT_6096 [Boletus reticuloceps]|uniref:Uncharacterized protein n=1 Tax=Boletus reticuloceps TaxID=495285 RepID=A0A8I2YLA4_9AGAM|nr:hypothetical protein JVT61DRAFT_6096 [Boletus reticuloceps]